MKVDNERIKAERMKRTWSQEHLAGASGLGLRTIRRIENSGSASLESIKALARVLELDFNDLCTDVAGQNHQPGALALWSTVIYAFLLAMSVGAIVLDIGYARLVGNNTPEQESMLIFMEIADALLALGLLVLVSGVIAVCFTWSFPMARYLLIASIALNLLVPFLLPFVDLTQGPTTQGAIFRVVFAASKAVLAFAGLWILLRLRYQDKVQG